MTLFWTMSFRGPCTYVTFFTKFHFSNVKSGIYESEMCILAQRGFCSFDMNTEIPLWAANVVFFSTYVNMNTPPGGIS